MPDGPKALPPEPKEKTPIRVPERRNEPVFIGATPPADSATPSLVSLPAAEQQRVDQAIDKGVSHLKNAQTDTGMWPEKSRNSSHHEVGYTALPALTLLECGELPDSPVVKKAAEFVRKKAPNLYSTYELSLSILFLDRLGNPDDSKLIQMMSLRLISGQKASGGWTYECREPQLNDRELDQLLTALQTLTPTPAELLATTTTDKPGDNPRNPSIQGTERKPAGDTATGAALSQRPPLELLPERILAGVQRPVDGKKGTDLLPADVPERVKKLPVLQDPDKVKEQVRNAPPFATDNSNTQFAILALLAAKRHGVPMERSLALMVMRFQTSQNRDGSWGYHYKPGGNEPERPTMTGVGLLGLAVGHGLAHDIYANPNGQTADTANKQPMDDKMVKDGFKALAKHIQQVSGKTARRDDLAMHNLYFLWTVERVAVLYQQSKILDKDWYAWARSSSATASIPTATGKTASTGKVRRPSTPASPCCSSSESTSPGT